MHALSSRHMAIPTESISLNNLAKEESLSLWISFSLSNDNSRWLMLSADIPPVDIRACPLLIDLVEVLLAIV